MYILLKLCERKVSQEMLSEEKVTQVVCCKLKGEYTLFLSFVIGLRFFLTFVEQFSVCVWILIYQKIINRRIYKNP